MTLSRMPPASGGAEPCSAKPLCDEASPPRDSERVARPPWISHLEGRTLVEGIAEAFRHPLPGHPDPIGELLTLGEAQLEQLCRGFMKYNYPEAKYSADARARVHEAFRRRAVDGMRDGHAQFRAEIAELQATTPEEAMQMCAGASSAAASERPAASLGDGRPLGQRACPSTLAHRPCAQGRAARRVSVQRRELPSLLGALSRLDPARGRGARQPPGAAEHGGRRRRLPRLPRRAQGGGGRRHVPHPRVRPSVRSTPFYLHSLSNNGEHAGGASPPQPPPPPHHVRSPAACASQDPRRMLAHGQGDGDCIGCRAHVPALSRRVALHAHVCAQGRIGVMLGRSCTCRRPFWGAGRAGSRSGSSHLHIVWSYIRYILYELSVYDWRPVSSPDPYVNAVSSCPGVVRVCSRRRSGY